MITHEDDEQKLYDRRSFLIGAGKLTLTSLLLGRLGYLQLLSKDEFQLLADKNRLRHRFIAAPRARLLDRFGNIIAENKKNFRLLLYWDNDEALTRHLDKVSDLIKIDIETLKSLRDDFSSLPKSAPILIKENLSWDEVVKTEVHSYDYPSFFIETGMVRHYPTGPICAPITGYVSSPSKEQAQSDSLFRVPGYKVGKQGIENILEEEINNLPGAQTVEIDARGLMVRELKTELPTIKPDVHLSIDLDLQNYAYQLLSQRLSGTAIVCDVKSGEILALVSTPSFDPNQFVHKISKDYWKKIQEDPQHPMVNKAACGTYPPGSTFKIVTALAALENKIITPQHRIFCSGKMFVGNHPFHCAKKHGHGSLDLYEALGSSCDVYFYELAKMIGIEKLSAMARTLGFDQPTQIEITGEKAGLIPDKDWKRRVKKQPWSLGETVLASIGQGYVNATPIQLLQMINTIATDGIIHPPTLIKDNKKNALETNISKQSIDVIKAGLLRAVNDPSGTAFRARLNIPNIFMSGKTGTAQVKRISLQERKTGVLKTHQRPWHERDHSLFVGFAPHDNPVYSVAVVVEHSGWGSESAAPVARDLINYLYKKRGAHV